MKTVSEPPRSCRRTQRFTASGGGVTPARGECTAQTEAARDLLMECKAEGINTATDKPPHCRSCSTSAHGPQAAQRAHRHSRTIDSAEPERAAQAPLQREGSHAHAEGHQRQQEEIDLGDPASCCPSGMTTPQAWTRYQNGGVDKYASWDKPYPIRGRPQRTRRIWTGIEGWMEGMELPGHRGPGWRRRNHERNAHPGWPGWAFRSWFRLLSAGPR